MAPHSHSSCYVTHLPLEIFDAIALELTDLEPIGPPDILVPLMQTCKALHGLLVPETNPGLYSRIFRQKFDVAAVTRRAFRPTPTQCVDQMTQYFAALRVFRRRELRISVAPGEELPDVGVEEALQIGVVMMLEDDGKNARQLVQWGHADEFVDAFVRSRLYDGAEDNDGWPLDNGLNAHALWLMWLLTTEESLLNETPAQRAQITQLLLPFVYVPYRYPTALAPPNHYLIPPPITPTHAPSTIPTPHGPYPIYPDPDPTSIVHYTSRPQLARPLSAIAAKLLFLARAECTPFPIPPHFDRTREEAWGRGKFGVGPTREDMEEFNWSWSARLPGGRAWPRLGGPLHDEENPFPSRPEGTGKSAKWDADWMRLRMCGDLMRMPPRVPYGRVYEPFSMEGLWVGRMLIPGEAETQALINTPLHPPHGLLTEPALGVAPRPFFVRLQELHGEEVPVPFALGAGEDHDGMNNAWFEGDRAFEGRGRCEGEDRESDEEDRGEGEVEGYEHDEGACVRCLQRAEFRRRLRLGEGPSSTSSSSSSEEEEGEGEGEGGDELMTPWDVEEGWVGGASPPAHEWERRGKGRCDGLGEVVLVGKPDPAHALAFHPFTYHGRIRPWDGLLLLLRSPTRPQDAWLGTTLFCGYVVGGDTVVGSWRIGSADPGGPGWGGGVCYGEEGGLIWGGGV
ncbi:hypothetical protein FPV67DRAFT_1403278 [Lyophyllum atratum]|nr:hypothetical protein FPV67DRAFT_1403278 [Lyophyllum atratum]